MKWTNAQEYALEKMRDGDNVFLTGEAGTGKSEVVKAFIQELRDAGKNILITAPTGIAADNLGGETLHRVFEADIGVISNRKRPKSRNDLMKATDAIIIDEISMCRIDLFEYVAQIILTENEYRQQERFKVDMGVEPDGRTEDIQLIVLGDFLQLPPVVTKDDAEILPKFYGDNVGKGFAFQSLLWDAFNFTEINLTEIVRQEDVAFKKVLSRIRVGKEKRACVNFLQNKSSSFPFDNDESIYLCGINRQVAEVNENKLANLPGETIELNADCDGDIRSTDKFADDTILLKPGCKVMMTVNALDGAFKNGSMGKFIKEAKGNFGKELVIELAGSGDIIRVGRYSKTITKPVPEEKERKVKYIDDDGVTRYRTEKYTEIKHEEVGSFSQFPLKLAYAIPIHKSQGKTFEYVNIDPYCWDDGQFYTAVSRGKRLENICFTGVIKESFVKTSKEVLKKFPEIAKAV